MPTIHDEKGRISGTSPTVLFQLLTIIVWIEVTKAIQRTHYFCGGAGGGDACSLVGGTMFLIRM